MKTRPILVLFLATLGCLLHTTDTRAQIREEIDFVPPIQPPRIELRTPDVGPMQTREMSINARVDGLYAEVETTIVFHNPNARDLEGELVFPLPDGAAVCGYALDINGALVDGVVVTKDRARVAFETETRRNVDPGLVEHIQGNLYRTRIYPLPANGERRIRLTYTTPLVTAPNGDAALLLPLPREEVAKLKVNIEVAAPDGTTPQVGGLGDARFEKAEKLWRVESASENTTPGEDILVALPKLPASFHRIEQDTEGVKRFMITTVAPVSKAKPREPGIIHVLWDASGSRAGADLSKEFALLKQTEATGYTLTIFRDVPETTRKFTSVGELLSAIKDSPFDGGTDMEALAAALKDQTGEANAHTLLFTDGFDTLSGEAPDFGENTPVAVVSQTVANREALRQACAGAIIDLQTTDAATAWSEIHTPSRRVAGVKGTGIANVQGIGQPAHGRINLLGELTAEQSTVRIVYADGTESEAFELRAADATEGDVLATAWASARVNQLTPHADEFADELLALGRNHGLVSPVTSLIVLESLDQWVRHEIEPPATLPEMRKQWRQAMKNRANQNDSDPGRRLDKLVALWKQRVEWWKTDFSNAKVGPLGEKRVNDDAPGAVLEDREAALGEVDQAFEAPQSSAVARRSATNSVDAFSAGGSGTGAAGGLMAKSAGDSSPSQAAIEIKPWSPDTPYLKAIRASVDGKRYATYLKEREKWSESPAFFLDCADLFYRSGDEKLGRRILTNLAELRIEDPGLLRVLAWRLQQAGELDTATVILRRIAKLRPEEPQSFRDLALVLTRIGRDKTSKAELEEAMELYLKVAMGDWNRHGDSIAIFALEELNALIAWVGRQKWSEAEKPQIPEFDERLRKNLDTDIRIVMSWDADATDMDLHVIEPGGEEAYYGHNRTARGGLVSQDITDGYGPEEYLIRTAPSGSYTIKSKYYGSRQQTVIGPATVTATVFTNWGRANQERRELTIRLEKQDDMVEVGAIKFSRDGSTPDPAKLGLGITREEVIALLGEPQSPSSNPLVYSDGAKTLKVFFDESDKLIRVTETLPGGNETIILQ